MKTPRPPARLIPLVAALAGPLTHAQDLHVVALGGTDGPLGPGLGPGVEFTDLLVGFPATPVIDASGDVAFTARIQGPGVTANTQDGVWEAVGGTVSLVAREGFATPNDPTANFLTFNALRRSAGGDVGFIAGLQGPGVSSDNDVGIYVQAPTLTVLAREGTAVSNFGSSTYPAGTIFGVPSQSQSVFVDLAMSAAGDAATFATVQNPAMPILGVRGAWRGGPPASFDLAARTSDPAPGGQPGDELLIALPGAGRPLLTDSGDLFFLGLMTNPNLNITDDDWAIWRVPPAGGLIDVFRESTPLGLAPGVGVSPIRFDVNGAGDVAIMLQFSGPGVTPANDIAIVVERGGGPSIVAREGDPVPFLPGFTYTTVSLQMIGGDSDVVFVFLADDVAGGFETGVVSAHPSGLGPLILAGDAAPGLSPGAFFPDTATSDTVINAGRRSVFLAMADDPVMGDVFGLWSHTPTGGLELVAYEGQAVEIVPGDTRAISDFIFSGLFGNGENGLERILNADDQLVFGVLFDDGFPALIVAGLDPCVDLDGDGATTMADFAIFAGAFGTCAGDPAYIAEADLDGSGCIDLVDFGVFAAGFGCVP